MGRDEQDKWDEQMDRDSVAGKLDFLFEEADRDCSPSPFDDTMTETVEALVLDLLEWVSLRERSYEETMEAWRTSCPRLPVWEDANDLGLICVESRNGGSVVRVTAAGREFLKTRRQ